MSTWLLQKSVLILTFQAGKKKEWVLFKSYLRTVSFTVVPPSATWDETHFLYLPACRPCKRSKIWRSNNLGNFSCIFFCTEWNEVCSLSTHHKALCVLSPPRFSSSSTFSNEHSPPTILSNLPFYLESLLPLPSHHNSSCLFKEFLLLFLRFFDMDHSLSLLNLLQDCVCFMFWFFIPKVCGILAPWPGIKSAPPTLGGKVLPTRPPGRSLYS